MSSVAAEPVLRSLGDHQLHRPAGRGLDQLKGKKIVTLYHGSPYGKETNEVLQTLADKYGFKLTLLEVPHPGNEQQSQWLNIRRENPTG